MKFLALSPVVCFYFRMKKEVMSPIRIEADKREHFGRIGAGLGLSQSALIRLLVKSFLDLYDRNKGKVVFPLNLKR
jgi:hypothetical protein